MFFVQIGVFACLCFLGWCVSVLVAWVFVLCVLDLFVYLLVFCCGLLRCCVPVVALVCFAVCVWFVWFSYLLVGFCAYYYLRLFGVGCIGLNGLLCVGYLIVVWCFSVGGLVVCFVCCLLALLDFDLLVCLCFALRWLVCLLVVLL